MKKVLVACSALCLTLLSVNAYAVNLNGLWKGSGKFTDNRGMSRNCESMEVKIVHTATVLNVDTTFVCGGERANAPGGNLELRGSEIWEKGKKIGTISANSVVIEVADAEHTLKTTCNFTDKEMSFHTVTTFAADPGHVFTFDGKVSR